MPQHHPPLEPGKYYHIFNHAIGRENLFREKTNYEYFLSLYDKYISPIAYSYAWVLMPNHFHLFVRMKDVADLPGFENLEGLIDKSRNLYNQAFSNLFNAYTKAYNKKYQRMGSLFCKTFKRISVNDGIYLKTLVVYIHKNPVKHGFTDNYKDYAWSSYGAILSKKQTKLQRNKLLGWFDGKGNFLSLHNTDSGYNDISDLIIE
jgi:REP element-mobilizing transposase RayT